MKEGKVFSVSGLEDLHPLLVYFTPPAGDCFWKETYLTPNSWSGIPTGLMPCQHYCVFSICRKEKWFYRTGEKRARSIILHLVRQTADLPERHLLVWVVSLDSLLCLLHEPWALRGHGCTWTIRGSRGWSRDLAPGQTHESYVRVFLLSHKIGQ